MQTNPTHDWKITLEFGLTAFKSKTYWEKWAYGFWFLGSLSIFGGTHTCRRIYHNNLYSVFD